MSVTSESTACASTTTEISTTNLVTNSDFLNTAAPIGTGGGVSTSTFDVTPPNLRSAYQSGNTATQATFPGDPARNVAASTNWLFANGNNLTANVGIWWRQTVSGLVIGQTHTFVVYGSSPVNGAQTSIPSLSVVVTQASSTTLALGAIIADTAALDVWQLYQATFLATQTTATFAIVNSVRTNNAEPRGWFALAQPTVRRCAPLINLTVSKSNSVSTVTSGVTTTYSIVVGNAGPNAADGSVLTDSPSSGLNCTEVSCTATGGSATCPVAGGGAGQLSIGNLIAPGTGVTLTSLPASSSLSFTLACSVIGTDS